ncbi:MAG: YdcF family protein [Bryobacterales bacterium]|nr:YdcF family protein [Bryobacterales bacterium]
MVLVAALALLLAQWSSLAVQIRRQAQVDEARPADVIVVLGAAAYRGRPSPVFKARLDHALALYRRGLAPRILTTGGSGGDPVHTEGEVGRAYLVRQQVPSEAILVEPEGESTVHSLAAAAEIMRRMNLHSCILVSDDYHIFRAKRILEAGGFRVYGSPRPGQRRALPAEWWLCLRQALAYWLWKLGVAV